MELVKYLVENRRDGNTIFGLSPYLDATTLETAAKVGNLETVKYLVESGADVPIPGQKGFPIHSVCRNHKDSVDIFTYLMEINREQLTLKDKEHNSCLHLAAEDDAARIVRWLLQNQASTTEKNSHRMTPWEVACRAKSFSVIGVFLRRELSDFHFLYRWKFPTGCTYFWPAHREFPFGGNASTTLCISILHI
ncbi:ankyrin repeat-containing domain protein [Xylariaceae sp. FL0255]|nr:ankyrin repeat-containing domain protein [Xylariaceae sp. FL0255]